MFPPRPVQDHAHPVDGQVGAVVGHLVRRLVDVMCGVKALREPDE